LDIVIVANRHNGITLLQSISNTIKTRRARKWEKYVMFAKNQEKKKEHMLTEQATRTGRLYFTDTTAQPTSAKSTSSTSAMKISGGNIKTISTKLFRGGLKF